MIHIFGDSHANFNFSNSKYTNILNHYQNSITMNRVGRDNLNFINFINYNIKNNDIIIYQFGEVDCRCHIARQLLLGRVLDDIINELVTNYINSIKLNTNKLKPIAANVNAPKATFIACLPICVKIIAMPPIIIVGIT